MQSVEIHSQKEYLAYSKKVHSYSTAVGRLHDLSASYVHDAEKAHRAREIDAVWTGIGGWEIPLIYSLGLTPVSFSEMGRLSDPESIGIAEDYYQFPPETCSMVKCTVGQWHQRNDPGGIRRILGNSSVCEPYNLALEIMKNEGFDVYNIDVVYRGPGVDGKRLEQLVAFFVEQIYGVSEWLTGKREIDEERLRHEIQQKNRVLAKVRKLLELRIKHPFYIKSLAITYLLNGLNTYFGKPGEYEEVVNLLLEELSRAKGSEGDSQEVIPLVWAGGMGQEFGVYQAIDEAGGALLGFRSFPFKNYREDVPPVEALARYVLDNQNAGASVYARHVIEHEVSKVRARGLILYRYLGCSYGSVAREMFRDYFHKKGIPSINLEGTFQVGAPTGQILTRVKAFVEMLS
jgi:benzoyl-CoA reductase/2-hydroxyglutaryl-CoA dehydratase subunit BcrC/BadD/HgdB